MTRDEAIARGYIPSPTIHNGHRRALWHDYNAPGLYMLTLVSAQRLPLFGKLIITENPYISLSALGNAILQEEIFKSMAFFPMVDVWRTCIMPDHIHMKIRVKNTFPPKKHLGHFIRGLKIGSGKAYQRLSGLPYTTIFEEGYNDRLLLNEGQLERWHNYLLDNPRRLALKRQHPDLFTVMHNQEVAGIKCMMVGNRFLLDIPDKEAIIVHRSDMSDGTYEKNYQKWLACAERGGVLVSGAIAPGEKAVIREAMNQGYRIILLRQNGFGSHYKPSGERFNACLAGHFLEISPWDWDFGRDKAERERCLFNNSLALRLANE
ncbi:MAG: hypothetical protein LIO90_04995 [Bacteroidales bacterium]|nr:hypothetical protein [Bacteroidales bacterium]